MSTDRETLDEINDIVNNMLLQGYVGKKSPAEDKLEVIDKMSTRTDEDNGSAQEKFDAMDDNWQKMSVESIVQNWLVGQYAATSDDEYKFKITEVLIRPYSLDGEDIPLAHIFIRGKDTVFFDQDKFKIQVGGL